MTGGFLTGPAGPFCHLIVQDRAQSRSREAERARGPTRSTASISRLSIIEGVRKRRTVLHCGVSDVPYKGASSGAVSAGTGSTELEPEPYTAGSAMLRRKPPHHVACYEVYFLLLPGPGTKLPGELQCLQRHIAFFGCPGSLASFVLIFLFWELRQVLPLFFLAAPLKNDRTWPRKCAWKAVPFVYTFPHRGAGNWPLF